MSALLHELKIGNVTLPNNLVLSPMAGFSDLPFRILCRRHGAGLVSSEMVSSGSVERKIAGTLLKMRVVDEERPTSVQIFGTDPASVANAAVDVARECEIIGFNMGCPAWQIRKQGCGAALLDKPDLAIALVEAIKGATDKPLLAKLRLGTERPMDFVTFARRLERAGADALIVHGRTAKQGYSGKSDWASIGSIKAALGIPVIVNGDVVDGPTAERALLASGADGVALGRATLGDPRVFDRVARYLTTGERAEMPTPEEQLADFAWYAETAVAAGLDRGHVVAQAQQFTRGLRAGGSLRQKLAKSGLPVHEALALLEAHVAWLRTAEGGSLREREGVPS